MGVRSFWSGDIGLKYSCRKKLAIRFSGKTIRFSGRRASNGIL